MPHSDLGAPNAFLVAISVSFRPMAALALICFACFERVGDDMCIIYDKGYGPMNVTLKQYLNDLFPPDVLAVPESAVEPLEDRVVMSIGTARP